MYCPNCGTLNEAAHIYCRSCGLKIDDISRTVKEQFPSPEYAAIARRKVLFEKLGLVSLAVMILVGLSMLLYKVGALKAELFGEAVLLWSAFAVFAVFGLAAVFFFNYGKMIDFDKLNPRLDSMSPDKPLNTQKLIEDRIFEPASVTEHSTELLKKPR